MEILPRKFYARDVQKVARDLLGKKLIRTLHGRQYAAIIAEIEAYRSDDPACHAYRGQTKRNAALFGPVGHTYVYKCYGIHDCLNVVSKDKKFPAGGVLIRGLIFLNKTPLRVDGPGKITKVLKIDRSDGGIDVTCRDSALFITQGITIHDSLVDVTSRIGLSVAQEVPWRFVLKKEILDQV